MTTQPTNTVTTTSTHTPADTLPTTARTVSQVADDVRAHILPRLTRWQRRQVLLAVMTERFNVSQQAIELLRDHMLTTDRPFHDAIWADLLTYITHERGEQARIQRGLHEPAPCVDDMTTADYERAIRQRPQPRNRNGEANAKGSTHNNGVSSD